MTNTNKTVIFILAAITLLTAGYFTRKEHTMPDLAQTDPELAALWQNFVNKDVRPHGRLDGKTRWLVIMAAHIAAQSPNEYKLILAEALDNGITPTEAKEVIYQAIPYLGMAKVYDFLGAANEVLTARGIKLPLPGQSTTTVNTRLEKGLAAQKAIFGSRIDNMRAAAPQELKHIQDYLSANCFGDYYTRRTLSLQTRELLTFSLLAALGGADSQLLAHTQGNLNVGNDKQVLLDTITQLLPYIGYPRSLNAITAVNQTTKDQ